MLSYPGIQDALSAILVIIAVSVLIAVAWLSTNVREQPLIATAVVVFQSGVDSEGDRSNSTMESSLRNNESSGTQEGGERESVASTSSVKESESEVTEVMPKTESLPSECSCAEVTNVEPELTEQGSKTLTKDEVQAIGEETSVAEGTAQCSSSMVSPMDSGSNCLRDMKELHNPSCTSSASLSSPKLSLPSPLEKGHNKASQEMEVRLRKIKDSIAIGESSSTDTSDVSEENGDNPGGSGSPDGGTEVSSLQPENETKETEVRPPGSIRIRLKFLDETQKYVFAQPTEKVGSFKRQHFSIEMDANRRIRLIFNGQLLNQDSSTLAQCGLFDNCVVHCHVSQPQQRSQGNGQSWNLTAQDEEDPYISNLLAPLLYCVMVVMWYLRYEYSHMFNAMSTVILLFLTALLLVSTYILYITQDVHGVSAAAQLSAHPQIDFDGLL